jgi:adenosylcobyric acid synthase
LTGIPALMIQGTGSNAGKSTIVAGLARCLIRRGLRVMPFKPQNMSNNASATADGGEIGRAQAFQARAARVAPTIDMNPILLKPENEFGSQVILQGRRVGTMNARDFARYKAQLIPAVLQSFNRLATCCDIILVEGAGSASEVNLRANDLANMGFAEAADVPVMLVGDIDRGGVIASLVGTHVVIADRERERIHGFIVNKFRGDPALFDNGTSFISQRTGWPCLGVLPWISETSIFPAEDSVEQFRAPEPRQGALIAVPRMPGIANFDDLDPLRAEAGVTVEFVPAGRPLPAHAKAVLIPGSKSTIADLDFFRSQGWDIDLQAHVRRGGRVLGLCGGFQMLGRRIADPHRIESMKPEVDGLGLLDVTTVMERDKTTRSAAGVDCRTGAAVRGYEIHLGSTSGPDTARPMFILDSHPDGASSADGKVEGTYLHGLFASDTFRRGWLAQLAVESNLAFEAKLEAAIDVLADNIERHLDVARMLEIARTCQSASATGR